MTGAALDKAQMRARWRARAPFWDGQADGLNRRLTVAAEPSLSRTDISRRRWVGFSAASYCGLTKLHKWTVSVYDDLFILLAREVWR